MAAVYFLGPLSYAVLVGIMVFQYE